MKTFPIILLLAAAVLLLDGCSSIDSRITEKQTLFKSLTPAEQANIKEGLVAKGYTPDMVYMALGKPDKVIKSDTPDDAEITWLYTTPGQPPRDIISPASLNNPVFDNPPPGSFAASVKASPTLPGTDDRIVARVIFRDGKAIYVQQQLTKEQKKSAIDIRITEKQTLFKSLTPDEQTTIKQGRVAKGYTPDMVYIALGKPDKVQKSETPDNTDIKWLYTKSGSTGDWIIARVVFRDGKAIYVQQPPSEAEEKIWNAKYRAARAAQN